jgi:putative membrane protein
MRAPAALPVAVAALLALLPAPLLAHGGAGPGDFWHHWKLDPWVTGPILLTSWLYARGVRRLWAQAGVGSGVRTWQAWSFAAGQLALVVALVSPIDALGGVLFSAHMLQHVLLMMVAAPLLVLGMPLLPFLWALPLRWRERAGGWSRRRPVRRGWHVLTAPIAAWSLHALALWVWHVPALYEATLYSEAVHVAQHASFFGTALLFWWAAFAFARRTRLRFGWGVIYVFTTALHSSVLGALLTFSLVLWYPSYATSVTLWGIGALEDQQLGGLVMWIPAGVVYVLAALMLMGVGLGIGRLDSAPAAGRAGPPPAAPVVPEWDLKEGRA